MLRHKFNQIVRNALTDGGFLKLETPYLIKSTPEGAQLRPESLHGFLQTVLCAASVASDLQATLHGEWLRPLFPNCPLLP